MRISVVLLVAASCALGNSRLLLNRLQNLVPKLQHATGTYPIPEVKQPDVAETYPITYPWQPKHRSPKQPLEAHLVRNLDGHTCLQLPAVRYHIPDDQIIPFVIKTIFNALGRPEPRHLVELANSKVLRQLKLYPRNVASTFQELRFNLNNYLGTLPLPNGYRHVLLDRLVKYFELLPKIRLGERQQQQEIYCQAKIIIALIEAYKGTPLEPDTIQKFLDATILLTRLVSGPYNDQKTLGLPYSQQSSEKGYGNSLEVEIGHNDEPTFPVVPEYPDRYYEPLKHNAPEKSEYNISVDINIDQEEYGRQPRVHVNQPTYQLPYGYEPQPSVDFHKPNYQLVQGYEPQPTVDVYVPTYEEEPHGQTVQPIIEDYYQQPKYDNLDRTEYNLSVDINIDQEEYGRQPRVHVNQPTYQLPYGYEPQPSVDFHKPNYQLVQGYEPQPTVDVYVPTYEEEPHGQTDQPIMEDYYQQPKYDILDRTEYNLSVDINIDQEEYGRQPRVHVNQPTYQLPYGYEPQPSVDFHKPNYQLVQGYEPQPTVDVYIPTYEEEPHGQTVQPTLEDYYQQSKYDNLDRTEYNLSVDINIDQEEYGRQPRVHVNQPTYQIPYEYEPQSPVNLYTTNYQPVLEYETQPRVDVYNPTYEKQPYDPAVRPITEEYYQQPEDNDSDGSEYISVDINIDQKEYGRQPKVDVSQPTYQLPYEYETQSSVNLYPTNYESVQEYERQPRVDVYNPTYEEQPYGPAVQPITEEYYQQPEDNDSDGSEYISVDINIDQNEYGSQPKVDFNQPTYQLPYEYDPQPSVNLYQTNYQPFQEYEPQPTVDVYDATYKKQPYVQAVQPITKEYYQPPKYNDADRSEFNISVDVNVGTGEYERQPNLDIYGPTYQQDYGYKPTVGFYQLSHEPGIDYEPQSTVDVYGPTYRQQPHGEPVQPITEEYFQQPKYNGPSRSEYNISLDIDVEQEQYSGQPKSGFYQPSYQPSEFQYNIPDGRRLEGKEFEPQPAIELYEPYQPSGSEYGVQVDSNIEPEYEPQGVVQHQPLYQPIDSTYNVQVDIGLEQEEREPQSETEVNYPSYQPSTPVDVSVWENQPKQVTNDIPQMQHELEEDYYPKDWIDFVPVYGADPDVQTPAYIPRPASIEETILPLQSTLQRYLTGNKPLPSLPKAIKTVEAVHRIRIDIKISIEKIVGPLAGYGPGLNDIVRQVNNLISPILPHIPVEDSSEPFGTSLDISGVPQNTPKIIGAVVKVILDALRNSHPSVLRVFRDILPKLFRTIFLPSSAPLPTTMKQVEPLIKLLEPVWDKLPHRPALTPQKIHPHLYDVIKMVKQLSDVNKNFPRFLNNIPRANSLDKIIRKIYYFLKKDGDCLNRKTAVQLGWEIESLKSAFPKVPASALKKILDQLQELVVTLKASCSNALIHRYVKDFESSLFQHWGIKKNEQLPENLFVQPILKSVQLHDLDEGLWGNFGDYIAALVGPSAPESLPARLAKITALLRRFYKRTIINAPNDYEVTNVALRIANLLAGVFKISHTLINQLRSAVVEGLKLIRDVIHGRREAHNLESIMNGIVVAISESLKHSPILQGDSHPLLSKFRGKIFISIKQYTKQIAEYQRIMKRYVPKINQIVAKQATRPLEQLLYRLPSIVKEMTKCSDILPYNSKEYLQNLLSSLSGGAVPTDMSYRLVNLIRQVRNQRCANHVPLPGSLGHLQTYLPGNSYKKWHMKFAMRKVFTQAAFTSSVNSRLNNHLLYSLQHLLGVIQPHVETSQQTAGDFVNSVRDWSSSLIHTMNQPQEGHSVRRSVLKLSAKFTAILRPQQKQPPPELTNKFMDLSNSILGWYQAPSRQLLGQHTKGQIQDIVHVLKSINRDVDSSQLQSILLLLVTHLQGSAVNKDEALDSSSTHVTSTIQELLGNDLPSIQKQELLERTKSVLAILRNKSACSNKYSSNNAQRMIQEYTNFLQGVSRTNLGPETQYLLQHLLDKVALTVTNTAMKPSIQAIPAPYEYLRPGYVGTCSSNAPVVSIPTGDHSLGQLWNLNLITALDTVKKGILLFLDDYGGHELARNVKEVVDTVLSTVTNDAISHSEKLSFSIKLALRINNGVIVPGNRDTLKSVREIVDLSDLLSGIRKSYRYQKGSQNVLPTINKLVNEVSGLYGTAPTPQFTQSFQHLIELLLKSRDTQNIQDILPLLDRTIQTAQNNWGHVVVPAKRISLNLTLRNLLVNIVMRITNSAVPISTWQPDLESFQNVAKVIAPSTNPNTIVDLLKQVVYPIQKSCQCNSPSQVPISKDLSNLLQHVGNIAYKGEGRHDLERYTVFDHLLSNVKEIACMKNKPHDKPDDISNDYSKYLHSLGLPKFLAKNQVQRLFSTMLYNLPASRQVFRANIQPVVPVLVDNCLSALRVSAHEGKKQRLVGLTENLLEVIKHNVFQQRQIQVTVKIVNSLLWYPNNGHLHSGLDNAFYQLLRIITEDNGYSRYPKVTELLRNIKVGLTLSAVNNVSLNPSQILISSRLQPQQHPSLTKALHDLNRSLQNRQSHQHDGPLFDALLNLVHEVQKVLVPTKQLQSVLQAKQAVVDYLPQIIQSNVSPQARNAGVMKTIGVIDEFINKLEIHFGIILPKPVKQAPAVIDIPEGAKLSNQSPAVLLAEFKGSADRKFA